MVKFISFFCNACFMIDVRVLILSSEINSFIGLKLCDILLFRDDREILCIHLYKNKYEFIHHIATKTNRDLGTFNYYSINCVLQAGTLGT